MPSTLARFSSCPPSWLPSCQVDLMPEAALSVQARFLEHVLLPLIRSVAVMVVQPAVEVVAQVDLGAAKALLPAPVRRFFSFLFSPLTASGLGIYILGLKNHSRCF